MTMEFAVVDVETTGVLPHLHDRVIEIAVVRGNAQGNVTDEYCSLVNPNRDVGSTRTHGIHAADLQQAPTFKEIAGDVLARLEGAVFVGHNVHFDHRFVRAEYDRIDVTLPACVTLCTMQIARRADPDIPSRRLSCLCEHFGIVHTQAHSAHADAVAAMKILFHCLTSLGDLEELKQADTDRAHWPKLPISGKCYRRTDAAMRANAEPSFLAQLVARLPAAADSTPQADDYLALLDRVLEDRRITQAEFEALLAHAQSVGLLQEQVRNAHDRYMQDLISIALEDHELSSAEAEDLEQVRRLLCIDQTSYEGMFRAVQSAGATPAHSRPMNGEGAKLTGKTVCFTGELQCTIAGNPIERSQAEEAAKRSGMEIKSGVSKKLDYLVTADADSMSGKAKKAREYGTRILAEAVFWRMVGVDVD